jgi:DNA polymerase III subunit delta
MFYIFHGDNEHAQRETLADMQSKMGDPAMLSLNTTQFEANVSLAQLRQACDAMPFLADKRLVIVYNLLSGKADYVKELADYLPQMPETTRLFFLESSKLSAAHKLVKLAESSDRGYVGLFERPQGAQLERWARQRVESKGGKISPRALNALVINVGNDLQLLDNEIEKLVLYRMTDGQPIELEDVALLCPHLAEANIFELVDALGQMNGRAAARILQQKINEGAEPFGLFAMFIRQFRLLIQVKELVDMGEKPPGIAKTLRLHNFVAGKLHQQCQRFSMSQLEQIYAHLLEIDVGIKTGRAEIMTALELFTAGVTAPGSG